MLLKHPPPLSMINSVNIPLGEGVVSHMDCEISWVIVRRKMQFRVAQSFARGHGCFLFSILSPKALMSPTLIWCNNGTGNFLQAAATQPQRTACHPGKVRSFFWLRGKRVLPERKGLGRWRARGKPSGARGGIVSSRSNHLCVFLFLFFLKWMFLFSLLYFNISELKGRNALSLQPSNLTGASSQF